jgi:hypothetical protein
MVLGEDPGRLDPLSNTSSLVLTLLWFVVAVGWAAWRAWYRQEGWRGSAVEVGLLAVVALVFTSAAVAARYQHPAWLVAWEWAGLLVAFSLVRQLARTADDNQGLLAALLATGVSLSAYALYQYAVELPWLRAKFTVGQVQPESVAVLAGSPLAAFPANLPWAALAQGAGDEVPVAANLAKLQQALAEQNWQTGGDLAYLEQLARRMQEDNVFATFAHPNTFAGYLSLLLPLAVGWALTRQKEKGKRKKEEEPRPGPAPNPPAQDVPVPFSFFLFPFAFCLVTFLAAALWLTHSRGALLATLVAGLALVGVLWHRFLWKQKLWVGVVLAGAAAAGLLAWQHGWTSSAFGKDPRTAGYRLDYWAATWAMIRDHPWWGVGPGNFSRYYPRYMLPTAVEKVKDPHNFLLEMWATCGLFTALALLATLAAFFARVLREGSAGSPPVPPSASPQPLAEKRLMEFYLAGMAGLILGFVLRVAGLSADEILILGLVSAALSVVWFAGFAVFAAIPWAGPARALVLAAGVAAVLLNWTVSGGVSFPSLAQPLWVVAALALNVGAPSAEPGAPAGAGALRFALRAPALARYLPLCVLLGLCWVYFVLVFYPVVSGAGWLQEASRHYPLWEKKLQRDWLGQLGQDLPPPEKLRVAAAAGAYLRKNILQPLDKAVAEDPFDAYPLLELARWHGELWKFNPNLEIRRQALGLADRALQLDPEGGEAYLTLYRLNVLFAQLADPQPTKLLYGHAAAALRQVVDRDPTDVQLRYRLAEVLFQADLGVEARRQAEEALRLDRQATGPRRKLTDPQREQVRQWLRPPAGS